jgi:para-aminobenzoate synthetase
MRTLLVDNYDSFTYNLCQYLTQVNGVEPVVLRNDDPHWSPSMLAEFDNVVLSPGPGTPERADDFGLCGELLANADLPVLGVCLGMQGIARHFGAHVGRAPQPMHGRTSLITHDGEGLFAGLPDPLTVVRYHSLAVTDLPARLQATAWTEDGVLMALRHRELPLHGVQFHPESVCAQDGMRLLRNFRDLTPRRVPARRPEPREPADAARKVYRPALRTMHCELPADTVFEALFGGSDTAFFLDSNGMDRFSVLGEGTACAPDEGTLDWLDHELRCCAVEMPEVPFAFAMGWVGYLGYELKSECGYRSTHRSPHPDMRLLFTERAAVLDHHTSTLYLLSYKEEWLAHAESTVDRAVSVPLPPEAATPEFTARHDDQRYLGLIKLCQEAIAAGESYELCLTNEITGRTDADRWQLYRRMRANSPAPMAAYLRFGDFHVLSSSPERFLRLGADGAMESSPIKGTRARSADPAADAELRKSLACHEKDRAENLMITDLVRNDLGRCALPGSVEVPELFQVRTFAGAHQLVSTVTARKRADCSAVDVVRAAFPPGSMTGAPKRRTMTLLEEWESGARGVYAGAIGYFSPNGAVDLSVVIRTAVLCKGELAYGVGGAVIALSDPSAELEETVVKTWPLRRMFGR